MKAVHVLALVLAGFLLNSRAATTAEAATPADIVGIVARYTIPRIDYESASLREVLDFIYIKYRTAPIDPPPPSFVLEYRLPEATLKRTISLRASDLTIAQAIELAFKDLEVSFLFERGKLIFIQGPKA